MSPYESDIFVCPRCRGELALAAEAACAKCGRVGARVEESYLDFGDNWGELPQAIAAWPEEFVHSLPVWAEDRGSENATTDGRSREALRRFGLVGTDGSMTALGQAVRYHLDEYRWQKGRKGLDGVLELAAIGPTVRALDVGCGAGQTLRRLEPDRPVALYGVDADPVALALGLRLARIENIPLTLTRASATALPFADGIFDLVLTRVALNYMHQRSALSEMARVLRPGGYLFCRAEGIWHDLSFLRGARGPKAIFCRLRDLGWGVLHAATGWQITPGSTFRGGRAFASTWRLGRILTRLGCRVVHAGPSPNGPQLAGRRTQIIVVAQKREEG